MTTSSGPGRSPEEGADDARDAFGLHEVRLPVTRTARLAVAAVEGAPIEEVWLLLHGYRQLAPRFLRHFRALFDPKRLLVAPEGLSRFYLEGKPGPHRGGDPVGASWMTREDREAEIGDYTEYLDRVLDWARERAHRSHPTAPVPAGPAPRLHVVGFSQGVHTAARWLALGKAFAVPAQTGGTHLVLWGASLPGDLPDEGAARFGSLGGLTLVRGDEDSLRSRAGEEAEQALLERWDVAYQVRTHPGAHRIDGSLLERLADSNSGGPRKP